MPAVDLLLQRDVLGWEAAVQWCADDGDRMPAGGDSPAVGGGVDTLGQAADDDDTVLRELRGELACATNRIGAGRPSADHGDPLRRPEQLDCASNMEMVWSPEQHVGFEFESLIAFEGPPRGWGLVRASGVLRLHQHLSQASY